MSTLNLNVSANCAKSWDRTCSSTQKAIHFAKKWTMEQHLLIADKGISKSFELSEDVCGMYDVDKVGQSATGGLTRSKDKKVINPFPEGVLLLKKVHTQDVYFSQSPKR